MTQSAHFAIRIEPALLANLTALAAEQDRTVSYIIRAACLRYVSEHQPASSSVPADDPIPLTAKAATPLGVKN